MNIDQLNHIQNIRSDKSLNGVAVPPLAESLVEGEIAVNFSTSAETLFIKNASGDVVPFSSDRALYNSFASKEWVRDNFVPKPVTIWETDGTSGLLAGTDTSLDLTTWQLENLNFSPYKYVVAYIKQADRNLSTLQNNYCTPSMMITIPLDEASLSSGYTAYVAGATATYPNDRNRIYVVEVVIDETKTKFKMHQQLSLYGTSVTQGGEYGRYCYKLVGHFY